MKLCWEILDKMRLTRPSANGYYKGGNLGIATGLEYGYTDAEGQLEYAENCKNCGKDYLRRKGSKAEFCDSDCNKEYRQWQKDEKRLKKYGFTRTPTYKEMIERNPRPPRPKQEKHNFTIYNNWVSKLEWCEEIRRDPDDKRFLQVRCTYLPCNKWFTPTRYMVYYRYRGIRGEPGRNDNRFYCSNECKSVCQRAHSVKMEDMLNRLKPKTHKYTIYFKGFRITKELKRKEGIRERKELLRKERKKKRIEKRKRILIRKIINILKKRLPKPEYKPTKEQKEGWRKRQQKRYRRNRNFYLKQAKKKWNKQKNNNPFKFKIKKLIYYTKVRSKQKKFDFDLDEQWIKDKINEGCSRTHMKFDLTLINRNPLAPSVDRIDITKGYTKDNCQVVIWAYNQAKGWFTDKDVKKMCKAYWENKT